MNRELVDIGAVIRQASLMVQRSIGNGAIDRSDMPKDTLHVYGDREVLVRLIAELVGYRSQVSGPVQIHVRVKKSGTTLVLSIKGTRVAGDQMPHVTKDPSFDIEQAGRVLSEHSGKLHIGDQDTLLELPMAVVPRGKEHEGTMEDNSGKCKVLVVDDNVDGAVTLSVILKHMGHSVRITHDGSSALAVGPEFMPDLVLMDIGMPGMDGYETCERMRAEEWSANVRVVALTGWGQEEDKRKARRAGFDLHLVKPVDRKTLIEVITATAEGRPLDSVSVQGNGGPYSRG